MKLPGYVLALRGIWILGFLWGVVGQVPIAVGVGVVAFLANAYVGMRRHQAAVARRRGPR